MKKSRQCKQENKNYYKTKNCYLSRRRCVPIFSAVSNVDLENLNISITAYVKDLLVPLIQQNREIRDFLNLRSKCMDPKRNFNNDLTDII